MRFPPLFARLATVLCLLATTCPKLPLLRDALERIDDALDDAMMKRRSKRRRKHEEEEEENSDSDDDDSDDDSDDDDEESLLLIKKSADSIAALRAMEHRRGRRALVKDAFAKKLAGERNTNSIYTISRDIFYARRRVETNFTKNNNNNNNTLNTNTDTTITNSLFFYCCCCCCILST